MVVVGGATGFFSLLTGGGPGWLRKWNIASDEFIAMSSRSLREVFARAARAAVPQSPLALEIELCLKQTDCFACHKYWKHCTLGCLCVTLLKAQLDFRVWKGLEGRDGFGRSHCAGHKRGIYCLL